METPEYRGDPFSSDTRRVAVLGGSSGIGAAVANLTGAGMGIDTYALGIRDFHIDDYAKTRDILWSIRPTHLVYSIGIDQVVWSHQVFRNQFWDVMSANVWGFVEVMQILMDLHDETSLPYKPSVVAISGDAARRPMRTALAYCASKAALEASVKVIARERAGSGWRVNAVSPGKVSGTPLTQYVDAQVQAVRGWTPEYQEAYERSSNALGRPATPEEVAQVVCDVLFGPMALNGTVVEVNGGR